MFCCILCCFVAKSLFYAIYAVLSRNLFCRDLCALAWRKIGPKILSVEKKVQIWGIFSANCKMSKIFQKLQNFTDITEIAKCHRYYGNIKSVGRLGKRLLDDIQFCKIRYSLSIFVQVLQNLLSQLIFPNKSTLGQKGTKKKLHYSVQPNHHNCKIFLRNFS